MTPLLSSFELALITGTAFVLVFLFVKKGTHSPANSRTNAAEKITPGKLPDPDPLLDFDLANARTRNHLYVNKPVRHPYYQTMAHQPMHTNDWIEIDMDYEWYLEEKAKVIKEQGKKVVDSLPENDEACNELLEVLVDWLPKRYPTLFENIGKDGIWNKVTNEKFTGVKEKRGVDALIIISRLVQDDFLMGRERDDGHVYFVGGLVAFPGFYLLSEKINMSLAQAHEPVPYFNEKILKSVERTLKRFQAHEPFERTSWEIVDDRNLFFHNIATIPSDSKIPATHHPKDLWFRVDHQTFRKLPRSKGIIFGVRPVLKRLEDLSDDPLVPALFLHVHKESDQKLMTYKLAPIYQDTVIPYLEQLHQEQIKRGLIKWVF
ncbi:hypothetical protein M422DRAFT_186275 [Sphaerobolus stellatus SS14]|uniref:Alpha-1,2-mannosyltransferase n=1 Tax=Sphaerobolus stellatus (strain SS14) TaxID=990650 RepID=A0A0C9UQC5_SPHS4|nr:hypothetical protein M422DRAFT_186275 [Sphaerobolus stellatus SS14]